MPRPAQPSAKGLDYWFNVVRNSQGERVVFIVEGAADLADIPGPLLLARVTADFEKERAFMRTLRAAENADSLEQLVVLAKTLERIAQGDSSTAQWETAFVAALDGMSGPHLRLLRAMSGQAGLRFGPQVEKRDAWVSPETVDALLPELADARTAIAAALHARGLLDRYEIRIDDGSPGGKRDLRYRLTAFGGPSTTG